MKIFSLIIFLLFSPFLHAERFFPSVGGIEEISLGFYLTDIAEIKDTEGTLFADFGLRLIWKDESMKGRYKNTQFLNPSEVHIPDFSILNGRNLNRTLGEKVQVDPDGKLIITYKFSGTLTHYGDYTKFPFDSQKFKIKIVFPNENYKINLSYMRFGRAEILSASGWSFGKQTFTSEFYNGGDGGDANLNYPMAVMELEGFRHINYYIWKIFFPMSLIVLIAWAVFWIHPNNLPSRINVAITANLTLIAYLFVLAEIVPQISYFTRVDGFIIGSLFLVFLSFIAVVITYRIHEKDNLKGERIQNIFKWFHLAGFLMIILYQVLAI